MKVTLNEVECLIGMYLADLSKKYVEDMDIDFIKERIQYWDEIKKKLLEN